MAVYGYAIDIKFSRPNKIYVEGETVSGLVSIISKAEIKHEGIVLEFDGTVMLQMSVKNMALLDAFSSGIKPIQLAGCVLELAPAGKIVPGKTEFPFQFVLEPKPNRTLFETYHGVTIAIQYSAKCDIKRSFPNKYLQKSAEFVVEYKQSSAKACEKPVSLSITQDSVRSRERLHNIGRFHVAVRLDSTSCIIDKPFTGELTVTHCDRPIRSIDLQLLRVEVCGSAESNTREISEIQTIQIGDGDVFRQVPIPIHMTFPRSFSCPTLETANFRIDFERFELIRMVDEVTKKTLSSIPMLKTKAGPRDGDLWRERLKEEYQALIKYVENNKQADTDWFRLEGNKDGTKWFGKCWHFHEMIKYEYDVEFDIPVTYPATAPEIALPELDGLTAKMYRGGKICLSDHFKPLWARNVPRFGIAHAFALGLGPWLAVEIPDLVERQVIKPKCATDSATASA